MEADRVVEAQVRRVPPSLLVGLALGSMAVSAAFAAAGKMKVATFIGQWVPSLLILATFDRLMQAEARAGAQVSALPNGGMSFRPRATTFVIASWGTAGVSAGPPCDPPLPVCP